MATIVTHRGIEEIDETPYWHLVPEFGLWAQMLLHNAIIGRGLVSSISAMVESDPRLENAHTPYSAATTEGEKEQVFEEVRCDHFPDLPSRFKAFYVFPSLDTVERAQSEWFASERKAALRAWIAQGSKSHEADAKLLDAPRENWYANAERYWSGEKTADPIPEVIVHGWLYFPDWESFDPQW